MKAARPCLSRTRANCVSKAADATSDRKSTRLNSSHVEISYAVFCLKKKKNVYDFLFIMLSCHTFNLKALHYHCLPELLYKNSAVSNSLIFHQHISGLNTSHRLTTYF